MPDSTTPNPPTPAKPQRPPLAQRLQPWVDLLYKLIVAGATVLALWKGLG